MASSQILISGAGCTGLVLALTLLKQGVPVRIIDKASGPRLGDRGAGLMPRSLELHDYLGTYDDIMEFGSTSAVLRFYGPDGCTPEKDVPIFVPVDPSPSIPHPNPVILGQDHQEFILRNHVERLGCPIEFSTELRSFEQVDDGVIAHIFKVNGSGVEVGEVVKYQYLVGADGARSTVRKQLGVTFLGETRGGTLIVGDIFVESKLDPAFWHSWGDPKDTMFTLRASSRVPGRYNLTWASLELNHAKVNESRESFLEAFYGYTKREDIKFGDLIWISKYRPNIRMVDSFSSGRVFLAGDAAHCHSPKGGQGMNSSVQDSFNLAWKLALVTKGYAHPSLLNTYNEERLPIIAEMLQITTKILDNAFAAGTGQSRSTWSRGGDLNQLDVNYRHSSIVVEQRATPGASGNENTGYHRDPSSGLRAGDRAPDATGIVALDSQQLTSDRIHKIFDITRHTVLFFHSKPDSGSLGSYLGLIEGLRDHGKLLKKVLILPAGFNAVDDTVVGSIAGRALYDDVVRDKEGHAYEGYGVVLGADDITVVVVRPDGVVGAITRDVAGVKAYFDKVFVA